VSIKEVVRGRLKVRWDSHLSRAAEIVDIVDNALFHENVRLGIRGHLNTLEGSSQQRSKSALEHAPGAGPKERMIARSGKFS
jgi:hypothetical protein